MQNETVFIPSPYQEAIFDFIINGKGNGIVNAVAGSGKTTTLVEAAKLIQGNGLFLAFNRHIAATLKERLHGSKMRVHTIHSVGLGSLSKHLKATLHVDIFKYNNLASQYVGQFSLKKPEYIEVVSALKYLIDYCRTTLTDAEDQEQVKWLCKHFGIIEHPTALSGLPEILKEGRRIARLNHRIDYVDMIWLPHILKARPQQYGWVFIDEAQDLSTAQVELALRCLAPNGRMLAVGDPNQSIYGFAGADIDSFENLKARTEAKEFPLSVSYRCPQKHVKKAQAYVPHIQAAPNAAPGRFEIITEAQLAQCVDMGDLILSRRTAPLVASCIKLLQKGIAAKVKGVDIAEGILEILEYIRLTFGAELSIGGILEQVDVYEQKQLEKHTMQGSSPAQIEGVKDKCAACRDCVKGFGITNLDELNTRIRDLFDDNKAPVWLSTVHKAKGLEEKRVFIISPDDFPLQWEGQQEWELKQEYNLKYIVLTRSTDTIFHVKSE